MGVARAGFLSRPRPAAWEALLVLALAAGCGRAGSAGVDRPIEVLVSSDPETLDPRYVTDAVGMRVTRLVHGGLVRLDPDTLAPVPYLAASWRWRDDRTLEIALRGDVRFHSGAPLTPRDVVATLRAFASPAVGSRHAGVVEAIADATEAGDHGVVVRLARPHATLLTDLEVPILRADQATSPPAPDGSLDGLGPFSVARASRGEVPARARGRRRPDPPPAHAVVPRTVHDERTPGAMRLEAGRADVAVNLVSPTLLPPLDVRAASPVSARPARTSLTPSSTRSTARSGIHACVARCPPPSIGPSSARRCSAGARSQPATSSRRRAGRTPGAPRCRSIPPGRGASSRGPEQRGCASPSSRRPRGCGATSYGSSRRSCEDVGLEADVVQLELGAMFARLASGDFDLAVLQLPRCPSRTSCASSSIRRPCRRPGPTCGRVATPALDALLDEGDRTPGIESRRAIYARLEAREREAMHWLALWYEDQVTVTSVRARSFSPSAEGRWLSLARIP